MKQTFKDNLHYFLIFFLSLAMLVFLPMVGSEIEGGFAMPKNSAEWAVFVVTKIITSLVNVLIFYCFMQQAKTNVKDNENYKKANEILMRNIKKERKPRSPGKWNAEQYGKKGTTIFFTTALSVVALTQALLKFDLMAMFTYLFTITIGIIFGILQMKNAEEYWTTEYYEYALLKERELDNAEIRR